MVADLIEKKTAMHSDINVKRVKMVKSSCTWKASGCFCKQENFLLDGSDLFLFYIIQKGLILLIWKQNNEDKVSTSAVTIKTSKKNIGLVFHSNI